MGRKLEEFFEGVHAGFFGGYAAPASVQTEFLGAQQYVLRGGGTVVLVISAFGYFKLLFEVSAYDNRASGVRQKFAVWVYFCYCVNNFRICGNDKFLGLLVHSRRRVHCGVENIQYLFFCCALGGVVNPD